VTAIRFFDMAAEVAAIRPDLDRAIARVLDHGGFVGGAEVERFERARGRSGECAWPRTVHRAPRRGKRRSTGRRLSQRGSRG
jgi:hypothetical protein